MTVTASPVPILKDNYAWLLRDSGTGATAIVDPADAQPIIEALEKAGGRLDLIMLTHHHADHIAGVDEVRARFGCPVVGALADRHRLPKLDQAVQEGDTVALGNASAQVIDTPGHTRGPDQFLFCRRRCPAVGRHVVQPGLRSTDRRQRAGNVCQPAQAGCPAGRHAGLLRPRIYRKQCALRACRRSGQRGAACLRRQG